MKRKFVTWNLGTEYYTETDLYPLTAMPSRWFSVENILRDGLTRKEIA
jgi:hypothetical protein